MEQIMYILGVPLNALMKVCYASLNNYVLAIVIFTLITKIILLPVTLWVQRKSIKMVEMMPDINRLKIRYFGDKDRIMDETQELYKRKKYHTLSNTVPMLIQIVLLMGVIEAVKQLFAGTDNVLTLIPWEAGGWTLLAPVAAAFASYMLTIAMNKYNPLQKEQSRMEQFSTGTFSVAISLFLGAFVSLGTCVYWIASNLFTIPLQWLMNAIINPKKYIDYEDLHQTQKELQTMEAMGQKVSKEDKKREKADYKRFFSIANKHLVFYSEGSGYYKYFEGLIKELLERSNVIIHYITNDPQDQIFGIAKEQTRIHPYYIGEKKLITLMMKMDADIVVMTTPDLETYHLKRSYVKKDIEYIFVGHGIGSINYEFRKGALDHFDTVYLNNDCDRQEIRAWEKIKNLPEKRLVNYGYPLMDQLQEEYQSLLTRADKQTSFKKKIVIAPSWQKDNMMDTCIDQILSGLCGKGYQIVVRPHPQYIRHHALDLQKLKERYSQHEDVVLDSTFSSFEDVYTADLLMTDWSGIGFEFSFTTCKPVLFIHTPPKIMNSEYELINMKSYSHLLRNEIGVDLQIEHLDQIAETVESLINNQEKYKETIQKVRQEKCYNFGHSAAVGAKDIIDRLKAKATKKKNEKGTR